MNPDRIIDLKAKIESAKTQRAEILKRNKVKTPDALDKKLQSAKKKLAKAEKEYDALVAKFEEKYGDLL